MLDSLAFYTPFIVTLSLVVATLWFANWLLIARNTEFGNERKFPRQLIMLGLTLFGLLAVILALPISEGSRNQLIGLIGILLSGMLAFSSTTVISNLMAGLLLRFTKPFRVGDFIRIGNYSGRVTERGLFDTEIQSEARELVALPNTYCISNPVTTIRSSGTIISTSLSLGYDIGHRRVESLLLKAAESSGLSEPFVHILELGNFAVTYRVSGFLEETKHLLSARSNLLASVLDTLHSQGVEIMSPTFMSQKRLDDNAKMIPASSIVTKVDEQKSTAEDIVFDKADLAEELENEKLLIMQEIEKLEIALKEAVGDEDKKSVKEAIEAMRENLKLLEKAPDNISGTE